MAPPEDPSTNEHASGFLDAGLLGDGVRAQLPQLEAATRELVDVFREVGKLLFYEGSIFGPDRVEGRTTQGYGDDRIVATAIAAEITAELGGGAIALLDQDLRYAAGALLRQLVEVDYLLWTFANDAEVTRTWISGTKKQRRALFEPRIMRRAADGHFADSEYAAHCDIGGHPTPDARALLRSHTVAIPRDVLWIDLANHLERIWRQLIRTKDAIGSITTLTPALTERGDACVWALTIDDDDFRSATGVSS